MPVQRGVPVPQVHPYCRWLVQGHPGGRKSTFFAGFPTPMLVLFSDPAGKQVPYLERGVPQPTQWWQEMNMPYQDVLDNDGNLMIRLEYHIEPDPTMPYAWTRLLYRLSRFTAQERSSWNTLVIDSLTYFALFAKYHCMKANNKTDPDQKVYIETAEACERVFYAQLGAYHDVNVCVACHVGRGERVDSIAGRVRPIMAPGRLGESLPGAFPETYFVYAQVDQNGKLSHGLQTDGGTDVNAFSQFIHAPNPCVPDYDSLWVNFEDVGDIAIPMAPPGNGAQQPQSQVVMATPEQIMAARET